MEHIFKSLPMVFLCYLSSSEITCWRCVQLMDKFPLNRLSHPKIFWWCIALHFEHDPKCALHWCYVFVAWYYLECFWQFLFKCWKYNDRCGECTSSLRALVCRALCADDSTQVNMCLAVSCLWNTEDISMYMPQFICGEISWYGSICVWLKPWFLYLYACCHSR